MHLNESNLEVGMASWTGFFFAEEIMITLLSGLKISLK